jgi:CopG family nickel-responsive transcriptional regulator
MTEQRMVRFGVSMNPRLLERFDEIIMDKGYTNRSEAIRDLVRDYLVQTDWEQGGEVAGTVTLIYNHHVKGLTELLVDLQHEYHPYILSTTHVHLDARNCLEVMVIKGPAKRARMIADQLISVKGVAHGSLSITSTGKDLP